MTNRIARRHPLGFMRRASRRRRIRPIALSPRILTSNFASDLPAVRAVLSGALVVSLLAACGSTGDAGTPKAAKAEVTVAEARFLPIGGSSLTGAAMLGAYDGGVQMQVNFNGRGPGRYRVMIHANGNCSSPNGFSAGPPWAPPGVPLAEEGFPILKNDDSASYVVRLAGYRLTGPDGVVGRSVVVHDGGTRNDRREAGRAERPDRLRRDRPALAHAARLVLTAWRGRISRRRRPQAESRWAFSPTRRS